MTDSRVDVRGLARVSILDVNSGSVLRFDYVSRPWWVPRLNVVICVGGQF